MPVKWLWHPTSKLFKISQAPKSIQFSKRLPTNTFPPPLLKLPKKRCPNLKWMISLTRSSKNIQNKNSNRWAIKSYRKRFWRSLIIQERLQSAKIHMLQRRQAWSLLYLCSQWEHLLHLQRSRRHQLICFWMVSHQISRNQDKICQVQQKTWTLLL